MTLGPTFFHFVPLCPTCSLDVSDCRPWLLWDKTWRTEKFGNAAYCFGGTGMCVYIYIICISNNHIYIYIYYMPQNISSHSSWRGQKTLWVWWFDGLVFHRKFHHTRLQRRASSRSRRSSGWSSYEARETWGSSSTISAVSHECQLVTKVFVGTVSFTLFHRDCSISMHFCDL